MSRSGRVTRSGAKRARKEEISKDVDFVGLSSKYTWIPEEMITCDTYNWPKKYEGYLDDEKYLKEIHPYRHVTNWYLARKDHELWTRVPLPSTNSLFNCIELFGELEPTPHEVEMATTNEKEVPSRIKIVARPRSWSVDLSLTRGIWIKTKYAWYKLEKPSDVPDGMGVKQEDIHLPLRAKFGLVSNLADMIGDERYSRTGMTRMEVTRYVEIHANHTPASAFHMLSPPADMLEKYPELNSEPFDWELLRREAAFVKVHLKSFKLLKPRCKFLQGLSDLDRVFQKAKKNKEDWATRDFDYLASAEASEKRSKQKPCGCRISGATPVRFHQVIELDAPEGVNELFSQAWTREHRANSEPATTTASTSTGSSSSSSSSSLASDLQENIFASSDKSNSSDDMDSTNDSDQFDDNAMGPSVEVEPEPVSRSDARAALALLFRFASLHDDDELGLALVPVKDILHKRHHH